MESLSEPSSMSCLWPGWGPGSWCLSRPGMSQPWLWRLWKYLSAEEQWPTGLLKILNWYRGGSLETPTQMCVQLTCNSKTISNQLSAVIKFGSFITLLLLKYYSHNWDIERIWLSNEQGINHNMSGFIWKANMYVVVTLITQTLPPWKTSYGFESSKCL